MLYPSTYRLIATAVVSAAFTFILISPTLAQSTPAERKAAQEQKQRELAERRTAAEADRKAKSAEAEAIAPREYDRPDDGISFKSPAGWAEHTPAGTPPAEDAAVRSVVH